MNINETTDLAGIPAQYVTSVGGDTRGFVRVGGVCVGRLITERDRVFFETKDRESRRSAARGTRLVRISLEDLIRELDRLSKSVI